MEAEHWRGHLHSNVRTHSFPPCKESSSKSYKQQYLFLGLDDWLLIFECVYEYLRHWPWKYKNLFWSLGVLDGVPETPSKRRLNHRSLPSPLLWTPLWGRTLYSPCQKISIWFLSKSSWRIYFYFQFWILQVDLTWRCLKTSNLFIINFPFEHYVIKSKIIFQTSISCQRWMSRAVDTKIPKRNPMLRYWLG